MFCKYCGKENENEICEDCKAMNSNNIIEGQAESAQTSNVETQNTENSNVNSQNVQTSTVKTTYTQATNTNYTNSNAKSKIAAGLFAIFLGAFGVHNFYLGYTGKAIAQLLITILSCFTLSWVSSLWGLIEGILILSGSINTDGLGNPLRD